MRRRHFIAIAIAVALALLAGACSSDDRDVLATVNGVDINVEQFETAVNAFRVTSGVAGGPIRLDNNEAAEAMTNLIVITAIRGPLAELGIELPELSGSRDDNERRAIGASMTELGERLVADAGTSTGGSQDPQARIDATAAWINALFGDADIDLDPAVGTWTGTGIQLRDPESDLAR